MSRVERNDFANASSVMIAVVVGYMLENWNCPRMELFRSYSGKLSS